MMPIVRQSATTAPATEPAFDLELALERMDGNRELLRYVLSILLEQIPLMMADVREAVAGRDAQALELAAHRLKGAVANIAARRVVAVAGELEQMGRSARLEGAEPAYAALEQEMACLERSLRAMLEWPR